MAHTQTIIVNGLGRIMQKLGYADAVGDAHADEAKHNIILQTLLVDSRYLGMSLDDVKTAAMIVKVLGILGAQHGIVEGTLGAGTDVWQVDDIQKRRSLTIETFYVVDSRENEIMHKYIFVIFISIVLTFNGYIHIDMSSRSGISARLATFWHNDA